MQNSRSSLPVHPSKSGSCRNRGYLFGIRIVEPDHHVSLYSGLHLEVGCRMNTKKILNSSAFTCFYFHIMIITLQFMVHIFIRRITRFGQVSTPLLIVGVLVESNSYLVFNYRSATLRSQERRVYIRGLYLSISGIMTVPLLFLFYDYKLSSAIIFLAISAYYLVFYARKLFEFSREGKLSFPQTDGNHT